MFKTRVLKVDIPYKDAIDDVEFWVDIQELKKAKSTFARLRLVQAIDTDLLSLNNLLGNGLNVAPPGGSKHPRTAGNLY